MDVEAMERVISDVIAERCRQNKQWGRQDHAPLLWLAILGEEVGEVNSAVLGCLFPQYHLSMTPAEWLREYRRELIQVAAVAMAAVESLDRNELGHGGENG